MLKTLGVVFVTLLVIVGVCAGMMVMHGLSTRGEPTYMETVIARTTRDLATPRAMAHAKNPVPLNDAVLAEARAHWADHCATCHANDGSGKTEIGRNLYPKAPDMRGERTQKLTDGEIFSIIKNGVRLTGMPAWGDANGRDDADSWKLVHFIRHLPKITPEEVKQMEAMNPVSPAEKAEEKSEEQFLEGK